MPTAKDRMQKINEILEILRQNGGKVTFGKLYGEMALKYGTTKNTFRSYLEALRLAGKIDYSTVYLAHNEESIEIRLKD